MEHLLYNNCNKEMRFSVEIVLNNGKKNVLGLLLVAVLIFVCSCLLFSGSLVSKVVARAAFVEPPTIDVQPVGYSVTYNANLQDLSVVASHSDENVTLEYAWYAKKTGQNDFVLVGEESIYPINGTYDNGSYYCIIVARDTDNDISEEVITNTVVVNILKVVLYASINNAESYYGEATATLSYLVTGGDLINGDTMEDVGIVLTKTNGNNVGTYQINGANNGENYYVIFVKGIYTVKPKKINIIIANKTSVYGESIKPLSWELYNGSTLSYSDTLQSLDITLTKESGNSAKRYAITGVCGNTNYNVTFITGEYTISKRTLMVNFEDFTGLVYNGKIQKIKCSLLGSLLLGDEANVSLIYNKTVKNAGTYIATAIIDNSNYSIVGGDKKEFVIAKKPLTIALNNTVIKVGETPIFTYKYIGFVEGENAENLIKMPKVTNTNTEIGDYILTPTGAEADNYIITFVEGTLRINKTQIATLTGLAGNASGSFAPDTTLSVVKNNSTTFSKLGSIVTASYKVTMDGEFYSDSYKITLNDVALNKYFMRVVMVDEDGIKRSVRSYEYNNGDLIVETNCQGYIVVYNDYLPIGVAAGVILLLILIVLVYVAKDKKVASFAADEAEIAINEANYYRRDRK